MLSAAALIPLIVTPTMGATPRQTAEVISTIFVVCGLGTLIQTSIGDRLPIVQGGSFTYLPPIFSIIFNAELQSIEDDDERFHATMEVISGSVFVVGITQLFVGYSGIFVPVLKFITPVTVAPLIAVIGLSLYNVGRCTKCKRSFSCFHHNVDLISFFCLLSGWNNISTCFPLGIIQIGLTTLFSQYLKKISFLGYPIFALFPVILAISLTWIYASIMTAADVWDVDSQCRTDGTRDLVEDMPWIRFPYPGQFGWLKFRSYGIFPMMGAMVAGMIESGMYTK
jgi:nucleobase transporter 1/2